MAAVFQLLVKQRLVGKLLLRDETLAGFLNFAFSEVDSNNATSPK